MASASKTPNLNLPQWVGTEKPERTDFNAAFNAIDTTVASHMAESVIDDDPHGVDFIMHKAARTYTGSVVNDYQLTVEENWSSMPEGASICTLLQGGFAGAFVVKNGNDYGTAIITGHLEASIIFGRKWAGGWTWSNVI